MKNYEFIDHTADIIARAAGDTLELAFAAAAAALCDVITGSVAVNGSEELRFQVESIDVEGLLVGFLSELIVIHEVRGLVLSDFEVSIQSDKRLTAVCRGEKFDPARHNEGTQVKGISYHMIEVVRPGARKPAVAQVLFDI
ncbi:MAG: archease [Deltaproteobacteria bacterium]|nr:archease [Deltaproteobacteria bacterium]